MTLLSGVLDKRIDHSQPFLEDFWHLPNSGQKSVARNGNAIKPCKNFLL